MSHFRLLWPLSNAVYRKSKTSFKKNLLKNFTRNHTSVSRKMTSNSLALPQGNTKIILLNTNICLLHSLYPILTDLLVAVRSHPMLVDLKVQIDVAILIHIQLQLVLQPERSSILVTCERRSPSFMDRVPEGTTIALHMPSHTAPNNPSSLPFVFSTFQ